MKPQIIPDKVFSEAAFLRLTKFLRDKDVQLLKTQGQAASGLPPREYSLWLLMSDRGHVRQYLEVLLKQSPHHSVPYQNQFKPHIPALFELDEDLDGGTGKVIRFCTTSCRQQHYDKNQGNYNFGSSPEYGPEERCAECDVKLETAFLNGRFKRPLPDNAVLSAETLSYLNEVFGPGYLSAHDITPSLAYDLLVNARDEPGDGMHPSDKEGYNAFAALHDLRTWDKMTTQQFSEWMERGHRASDNQT